MIICDKCHKEFEKEASNYATIFFHVKGLVNSRCDVCNDCLQEIFNHTADCGNDMRKEDEGK